MEHLAAEAVDSVKRLSRGAKYAKGPPCGRCGGTLRYTSSRRCVACSNAQRALKRLGLR